MLPQLAARVECHWRPPVFRGEEAQEYLQLRNGWTRIQERTLYACMDGEGIASSTCEARRSAPARRPQGQKSSTRSASRVACELWKARRPPGHRPCEAARPEKALRLLHAGGGGPRGDRRPAAAFRRLPFVINGGRYCGLRLGQAQLDESGAN